jgi:hypothetical protein
MWHEVKVQVGFVSLLELSPILSKDPWRMLVGDRSWGEQPVIHLSPCSKDRADSSMFLKNISGRMSHSLSITGYAFLPTSKEEFLVGQILEALST